MTLIIIATTKTFGQPLKDSVVDVDGNVYHTVKIGKQVWMVENLNVTHYRNGEAIPNVTDSLKWSKLTTGAYCNYKNDTVIAETYGRLYNWYAINDNRNICPIGWHIPADTEWTELTDAVGATLIHYLPSNGIDNNEIGNKIDSGFKAFPFGYRNIEGVFQDILTIGCWWSFTEMDEAYSWELDMYYNFRNVFRNYKNKKNGLSVRCVKDN